MKKKISALLLALTLILQIPAHAAGGGAAVKVQDGYRCDYGVDIPFTPSPRAGSYTFALYPGSTAAGTPQVTAEVTTAGSAQTSVHLPLKYDVSGPSTWTLAVTAHVPPERKALDREATTTRTFSTAPVCGCPAGTAGAFYAGDGSEKSPWRVATPEQLQHLNHVRHLSAGQHFLQVKDIDCATCGNWTPIGTASAAFAGSYDGDGHIISNLSCIQNGLDFGGLFGQTGFGKIERVGIENARFTENKNSSIICIGALVGQTGSASVIDQCYAKDCTVSAPNVPNLARIGGLIGQNIGNVSNCYIVGSSVTGSGSISDVFGGGLVGCNWGDQATPPKVLKSFVLSTAVSRCTSVASGVLCGATVVGTIDSSCFWTPTAGLSVGNGIVEPTTGAVFAATQLPSEADFGNQSNFTAKGWDFDSVWRMDAALGYPVLRAFDH